MVPKNLAALLLIEKHLYNSLNQTVRLDKWLWAARFYKTRSLARNAINAGKVYVNGHRIKPSRVLAINDTLIIEKGQYRWTVTVSGLSEKRSSAMIAQQLYAETEESFHTRQDIISSKKLLRATDPTPYKRPDKRTRRKIQKLKREH